MLAPAWLDHVALVAGIEPPARRNGFAWCDLGCGQGVTAAILAATHPAGVFHGIDAMPVHIDHARRLAAAAAIPNLELHAVDFAAAIALELPQFDYIVAHGVYTWVGPEAQYAMRRFIDRRLKPGGLVYLSYNAMPGWARDLPFQGLLKEFGRTFPGDDFARLAAAAELARTLAGAGVASLAASFIVKELQERPDDYPPAYLVHEFMPSAWQPLYVTEVRRDMATIGLEPVGSATLSENFDWMVLDEAARRKLGAITDPDARELVRDYYLDQRFRCDVFARSNRQLSPDERVGRLLSSAFALARPVPAIRYTMTTPAGLVDLRQLSSSGNRGRIDRGSACENREFEDATDVMRRRGHHAGRVRTGLRSRPQPGSVWPRRRTGGDPLARIAVRHCRGSGSRVAQGFARRSTSRRRLAPLPRLPWRLGPNYF